MSGPHPPNIPTQGVGGAAQPPDDSTDTRTPTPYTLICLNESFVYKAAGSVQHSEATVDCIEDMSNYYDFL